ncbi:MAG TPA: lysylphosphatidylglycerol synthase transmembrane domain-containing protein [Gemmatimonadales bacterium]
MTNPESNVPPGVGHRRVLAGIVGAVLALALLLWALRGVQLDEVVRQIRQSDPWPLALGVVLASLTFLVRLVRWRLMLRDESGAPLKPWPLWHATAIGFMANNLLPFRAGELVRVFAATKLSGARFTAAMSSIAVERIFDGLAVIALLAAGLIFSDLPTGVVVGGVRLAHAAQVAGLLGLGALLGAVAIVAFPVAAERMVRRVLPAGRFAERIVGMIEGLRHGMASLRSPGLLAGVVFWSLVHWLMNAAALWVSFAAFDIPVGFGGALVLQGVLAIGVSVQLTPGFVGQFEAAIVAALGLYGIPNDVASSYALAYHGATFLPITLAGAWSLARTPVALSDLRGASEA